MNSLRKVFPLPARFFTRSISHLRSRQLITVPYPEELPWPWTRYPPRRYPYPPKPWDPHPWPCPWERPWERPRPWEHPPVYYISSGGFRLKENYM